jgi:ribosomal protein S18 acetylase RimI-like enzyme
MEIRRAKLSDAQGVGRLFMQFWKPHEGVDPLLKLKKKPTLKSETEEAKKCIRKRKTSIFVAIKSDVVVGYVELTIKKNAPIFKVEQSGYIEALVVDKKHRKSGVGKELVKFAIDYFREKDIKHIKANVYFANRQAVSFWKKAGFRDISKNVMMSI